MVRRRGESIRGRFRAGLQIILEGQLVAEGKISRDRKTIVPAVIFTSKKG